MASRGKLEASDVIHMCTSQLTAHIYSADVICHYTTHMRCISPGFNGFPGESYLYIPRLSAVETELLALKAELAATKERLAIYEEKERLEQEKARRQEEEERLAKAEADAKAEEERKKHFLQRLRSFF